MPGRDDANVLKVVGSGPNQEACSRQGYDHVEVLRDLTTIQASTSAIGKRGHSPDQLRIPSVVITRLPMQNNHPAENHQEAIFGIG
jgi:hypothetical protein